MTEEKKNTKWVKGQSGNPNGRPRKDYIKPLPSLEDVGIKPQKGMQELAWNTNVDFMIIGGSAGSGKTRFILSYLAQYFKDPNFRAAVFRKDTTQLRQQGGMWEESKELYAPFEPKSNETDLKHVFRTGSSVVFKHLQHEKNKHSYQGGQLSAVLFDEITHMSQSQVVYLMSRLRSGAEGKGFTIGSCNPDASSWCLNWVEWWLDDDGLPDKSKQGIVRYYHLIDDQPVFGDTAEELKKKYPEAFKIWNPKEECWIPVEPKTFTFIAGTI